MYRAEWLLELITLKEKKMNRAVPKLQANPNVYGIPGKVLQIDGDKEY